MHIGCILGIYRKSNDVSKVITEVLVDTSLIYFKRLRLKGFTQLKRLREASLVCIQRKVGINLQIVLLLSSYPVYNMRARAPVLMF